MRLRGAAQTLCRIRSVSVGDAAQGLLTGERCTGVLGRWGICPPSARCRAVDPGVRVYLFLRVCVIPKMMKAATATPTNSQRGIPSSPLYASSDESAEDSKISPWSVRVSRGSVGGVFVRRVCGLTDGHAAESTGDGSCSAGQVCTARGESFVRREADCHSSSFFVVAGRQLPEKFPGKARSGERVTCHIEELRGPFVADCDARAGEVAATPSRTSPRCCVGGAT